MAQISLEMLEETLKFLDDGDEKRIPGLEKKEEVVDLLQKEITDFLVALSQQSIAQETSRDLASMMHMVNDLERVGDHCENLGTLGLKKKNQKITFTETGMNEIREIGAKTKEFLAFVVSAMERRDTTIKEKANFMENGIRSEERRVG